MKTNKNTYKVVRAIRELENKEICHEYYEVMDSDIETVLARYGIAEDWNKDESEILKEYLLRMAYQDELREIIRLTENQIDPILSSIPDRAAPSAKFLEMSHSIWKREMAKKKENPKDSQLLCEVQK